MSRVQSTITVGFPECLLLLPAVMGSYGIQVAKNVPLWALHANGSACTQHTYTQAHTQTHSVQIHTMKCKVCGLCMHN